MEISGLQKLTLLDYPGRLACTVFFRGCNFRCPFCHNADLVLPERPPGPALTDRALLEFLQSRRGKLDGVCITGGEPTLQNDLPELLAQIKALGFPVKLDTNGSRPQVLKALVRAGLVDYVAMDIKGSPACYSLACGAEGQVQNVTESAAFLMQAPVDYEFRTTVAAPLLTEADITAIGQWLQGAKRYYLQQFVDSGDLVGQGLRAYGPQEMEGLRQAVLPYIPAAQLRGV